jgi:hypothetical protein
LAGRKNDDQKMKGKSMKMGWGRFIAALAFLYLVPAQGTVPPGFKSFSPHLLVGSGYMPVLAAGPGNLLSVVAMDDVQNRILVNQSTDQGVSWAPQIATTIDIPHSGPSAALLSSANELGIVFSGHLPDASEYTQVELFQVKKTGEASHTVVYPPAGVRGNVDNPQLVAHGAVLDLSFIDYKDFGTDQVQAKLTSLRSTDDGKTWGKPDVISTTESPLLPNVSLFTTVFNQPRDEVAAAWDSDGKIFFSKYASSVRKWSDPVEVKGPASPTNPAFAVNPKDGRYYLAWEDSRSWNGSQVTAQILLSHSDDGGVSWSPISMIQAGPLTENHYEPKIAVDESGRVHAGWLWNIPFELDVDLYDSYSDDAGGNWANALRVDDIPHTVSPLVPWSFSLLVNASGIPHFIYVDRTTGLAQLAFSKALLE